MHFDCNFRESNRKSVRSRDWAEEKRQQALVHLTGLFENKTEFACIAEDLGGNHPKLKGHVNLNSPCTQPHAKKLIGGKFSTCKPSHFGDLVSLCRLLHVDNNLRVIGTLPVGQGSGGLTGKQKLFAGDPKFVVEVLLESMGDSVKKERASQDSIKTKFN